MRQDQHNITSLVEGVGELGTFDKFSGGGVDSDSKKYKPGNMGKAISLGGSQDVENVVIGRLYIRERDHAIIKRLMELAGRAPMEVRKQPLGDDGVPFGDPIIYKGTLKRVSGPEADSESTDPAMLELELDTEGQIG